MDEPHILFERRGVAGIVTLNRPKALHALTGEMCRAMRAALEEWARDEGVRLVVVRATGERAFCAGGDIRATYELGRAGHPGALDLFREEYRNNAAVKRFPKPYVALIDGVVMGGGAGICVHGSHRLGGERTLFAMPETGIGLFPDVGATFFLPRMPGKLGTYLALTGARLGQADALYCGALTHAVPAAAFVALLDELAERGEVEAVVEEFARPAPEAPLSHQMATIERCFAADTVEEILRRLDADGNDAFAAGAAGAIRKRSPTSLKLALRLVRMGADMDFETCMRTEFRVTSRLLRGHDFYEGIRAVLIDKDNAPAWSPATLDEVSEDELDRHFAPLPDGELPLP
ncbi:enoyl-CoA hydratase/isomerase family protein [Lutibaculum baratangense]|uniref:3-hydroxyisobutyryl-CoA hydrolase n=1 Tax=Lutibaculum baratangense AMV1 TaxID=631454 RepID=V4RCX8_9HYPH|nr:enoyl-CoA hydratase/isomerase family protein [Lutibaculum baratangense]ESR23254.1 3-hydroxyisobutyryl-CoA hydrolase [Lutibaculum baratangense AMV1]